MKRLNRTICNARGDRVKIYWDTEWEEYILHFVPHDGNRRPEEDYFTNDLDDAIGTALNWLEQKEAADETQ